MMVHGPSASQGARSAMPWSASRAIPRQIAASRAREAQTLHIRCARHAGVAMKASPGWACGVSGAQHQRAVSVAPEITWSLARKAGGWLRKRSRLRSSIHDAIIPRPSTSSGRQPLLLLPVLAIPPLSSVLLALLLLSPDRTYKCDPGVCMANNSCANGRSGVACGSCPDDPLHVLTVGICTRCPDTSPDQLWMWRAIFCVVGGSIVAVAWFRLCWAPVFGTTSMEIFMKWFGWYEGMPARFA